MKPSGFHPTSLSLILFQFIMQFQFLFGVMYNKAFIAVFLANCLCTQEQKNNSKAHLITQLHIF